MSQNNFECDSEGKILDMVREFHFKDKVGTLLMLYTVRDSKNSLAG